MYLSRLSLPQKVFLGVAFGILIGVLFGEYTKYLYPIGKIYTMLLEVVVYPYLISAIILSLGSISESMTQKILVKSWAIYFFLVLIAFLVIFIMSEGIPNSSSKIIIYHPDLPFPYDEFIERIIPKNFLNAIVNNLIPAVILFCVFFGLALQKAKHKEKLLGILAAIKDTSLILWNKMVYFSPYAVFAMVSHTVGTTSIDNFKPLMLYLLLIYFVCLFLALIVFPLFISCFTNLRYMSIIKMFENAMVIAISTSLSVTAIPYIEMAIKDYINGHNKNNNSSDNEDDLTISTVTSLSYPLAQVGNFCVFIFIIFAGTYYQTPISQLSRLPLIVLSFFSSIGSPSSIIAAVEFLGDWQHLPLSATSLYVEIYSITRYPQVLLSVMGMSFLSLVSCAAIFNKINLNTRKFLFAIVLSVFCAAVGSFAFYKIFEQGKIKKKSLLEYQMNNNYNNVRVIMDYNKYGASSDPGVSTLLSIRKNKVLRVGYNADMIPFAYFNKNQVLVGYDVAYMYELAHDLSVNIEFIPFQFSDLVEDIKKKKFDIAIGSIIVTPQRLLDISFTKPYFSDKAAFLVKKQFENNFENIDDIRKLHKLKISVWNTRFFLDVALANFKPEEINVIKDNTRFDPSLKIDSMIWTYSHAAAIANIYPGYTATVPKGFSGGLNLMAFVTNKQDADFVQYLNYWLDLKKSTGFEEKQYNYWILGNTTDLINNRWNIIDWLYSHDG